jgi:serine/threonine protein kinase/dipeptidyl aminopeptidase/acylaminoacyl peptidase
MTPERWREVEEIYQSAMDCAAEVRDAHLAAVCGGDDDLRREVESLLKLNSSPVLVDGPAWQAAGELLDNDSIVATGALLGPYRIESVLGAGGMGHVYRARDTRLDRTVAIKVSREEFNERFGREARAVAALNHPNICTLHDIGPNYLVMELVEGPTLAERIKQGPIPLEEALAIARQIAEALEAAHERGIVHRDLKPGNIKIKPDGTVKVLDFGLAKRRPMEAISGANPEDSPTISMAATEAGMILGTAAYMSPEQARGKVVDKRADIWAFGVVLYEMLTAEQLFEGATVTDTLAAVLTKEPDWNLPQRQVRNLLRSCLERDPQRRLRDIGDAWRFLEQPLPESPHSRKLIPAIAAALAILSAVALWGWWHAPRPPDRPLVRLDVDLGANVSLGSPFGADVIISPDGTRLVFVSQGRLFTRRLDQPQAIELPGTEGASQPFFAPDGQWVGFFAQSKLKKISTDGGGASVLCDAGLYPGGGHWTEDGDIIAALDTIGGLSRIPSAGGVPTPVTELDRANGEVVHRWPQVLPGGKAVLFTAHKSHASGFDEASIEVMSLPDRRRKTLHHGGTYGRYLPTGHLIYINRRALFALPFDVDSLEIRGVPTRVLEPVGYSRRSGFGQIDCSRTGTLVYRAWSAGGLMKIQWLYSSGKTEPLPLGPGEYAHAVLSPDGRRLAMTVSDGPSREVWIYDWQRQTTSKLTFEGGGKAGPLWSPDGRYVLFQAPGGIFWNRLNAPGKPAPLIQSDSLVYPWSFTADGKQLVVQEHAGNRADLWTMQVESDGTGLHGGTREPFLQTPFAERFAAFSPDGRWLAYESNESGASQVYVMPFHHKGDRRQISSSSGGLWATWSHTKPELYFSTEDGRIMVAPYNVAGDTFTSEQPRVWSEVRLASPWFGRNFDLAPDGNRIVALMPAEGEEPQISRNHAIFLENFFDELRRRVPRGR